MTAANKAYLFHKGAELLALCSAESLPISEIMLRRETALSDISHEAVFQELGETLSTMRASVERGLSEKQTSVSGLTGGDAERLFGYAKRALMGEPMAHAVAASMAVVEVNASMGRIVAAPTAGAKRHPSGRAAHRGGIARLERCRALRQGFLRRAQSACSSPAARASAARRAVARRKRAPAQHGGRGACGAFRRQPCAGAACGGNRA